jgi:DNA repair exonuclease SbcCD nuclease subunit
MPRILHASDLHLSESEREYSLAVFAELVGLAEKEKVDYLLFCGDLFNTFGDAEKLRVDFRQILGSRSFEFLFLPGNHEELQRGKGDLARMDWGSATFLQGKPFELISRDRGGMLIEFLAIPHQENYAGYGTWPVPVKQSRIRIGLAHGVVAGMSYRGPDEEGGGAALDPDMFVRFKIDYAALGHIHGRRSQVIGPVTVAYPGSSRVWRRHETDARGVLLLDINETKAGGGNQMLETQFIPLLTAGEYRHYALPLSLEGAVANLDRLASGWGKSDFIELEFSGIVEDERVVSQLTDTLLNLYGSRVRQLHFDRDNVSALPGIASQAVVQQFLEAWNGRMPPSGSGLNSQDPSLDHLVWLRARELGLQALKTQLEKRS